MAERTLGLASFSPARLTRVTVAWAPVGTGGGNGASPSPPTREELLLFNVGDALHVCRVMEVDKVRNREREW